MKVHGMNVQGPRGDSAHRPTDLVGEFTGYNNGPTMQVGLWITNDGDEYRARRAYDSAAAGWQEFATYVIDRILYGTQSVMEALREVVTRDDLARVVDWEQIRQSVLSQGRYDGPAR